MATLYTVLVFVHIACWAVALIVWSTSVRTPKVSPGMAHGIAAAVLTGIVLTGIASGSDAVDDPNNAKVAVKLVLGLIATGLAFREQRTAAPNTMAHVIAGLVGLNVLLALLW